MVHPNYKISLVSLEFIIFLIFWHCNIGLFSIALCFIFFRLIAFFLDFYLQSCRSFNYRDSDRYCSFFTFKGDSNKLSLSPLGARKSSNYCVRNSWNSQFVSNREKKPWTNVKNKEKNNNLCYLKVEKVITIKGARVQFFNNLIVHQKLFRFLGAPIIFLPIVQSYTADGSVLSEQRIKVDINETIFVISLKININN